MTTLLNRLAATGVMPILTLDDAALAEPTIAALIEGGIACGEVTLRTAAALQSLERIRHAFPDFLLGAGTIITVPQAQQAVEAGAQYLIAPGFSAEVARYCQQQHIPLFPGVMTPTDITQALAYGLNTLKLFPAGPAGGIALLKSFAGPFPDVNFIPTGGINSDNLASYLSLPNVLWCGGSWLARPSLLRQGDFAGVTAAAAAAVRTVQACRQPQPDPTQSGE